MSDAQFLRQAPEYSWEDMVKVCRELHKDPAIMVWPKTFNDTVSAADRRIVLKELNKRGWPTKRISLLVPLTDRAIREAIAFKQPASTSA